MTTIKQKLFLIFTTSIITLSIGVINFNYANSAQALDTPNTLLNVPFSTQAPLGEWGDSRQANGCEETSIIMAWMWATGTNLSPEQIRMNITGMSDFQKYFYGYYRDSSAEDTARLMTEYFGYSSVVVKHNITLLDIKAALDNNQLVIVPINPRIISTRYFNRYTINHTVVVVGYDDTDNTIIIHEPLHNWGGNLHIAQDYFEASLADYSSGQFHRPNEFRAKSMIMVNKAK